MSIPPSPRLHPVRRGVRIGLVVLAGLGLLGYAIVRGASRANDFKYPYGAARLLVQTGTLHVAAQPRYPITLHVLLTPLARLPIGGAAAVWAVLSLTALAATPAALARLSAISPRRQGLAWLVVAPFLLDALVLGQSDPINLFLVTTGLALARRGRPTVGTLLIGLAALIKILPVVQVGTLGARGQWRGVLLGGGLTAALGFGLLATAVGVGPAVTGVHTQVAWIGNHEKPWHLVALGTDLRANNESLPIVLVRTFSPLPPSLRDPATLALASWPRGVIWSTWAAVVLGLVVGGWAGSGLARQVDDDRAWLALYALTAIGMLTITPICWHHYFLWTLPAALCLADRPRLLGTLLAANLLVTALPVLRGLGGHMVVALLMFILVLLDLKQRAHAAAASPAQGGPGEGSPAAVNEYGRPSP